MAASELKATVLRDFDDPTLGIDCWTRLLQGGRTDTVFLTWHWQRIWWEVFGRGELLLIVVERQGEPITIAPLFCEAGMLFFVGSGGSDYLDFIGDFSTPDVLQCILETARDAASDFVGYRFYHVLDDSPTGDLLQRTASALGLYACEEYSMPAPLLDLTDRDRAVAATRKKSLVRHERALTKSGDLQVRHLRHGDEIRSHLEVFFQQHITRWSVTSTPSLFCDEAWKRFYHRLTEAAVDVPWLRFTHVSWNGRPVAYHFGFCYRGNYIWYKPTFDIELADRSPGEVLLRHLLMAAIDEGASTFDFGLGDESFKLRFATDVRQVRTWGLYPLKPEAQAEGHDLQR